MKTKAISEGFASAILAVLLFASTSSPLQTQSLQDEREAFEYAQALYSDGLFDTAADEYRRFILNYPTSERIAQARLRLGDSHYKAESLDKAVEAYQTFVDRHPDNIEAAAALRNRAGALEQLQDYSRAATAFSELYERFRTGEYAVQDLLSAGTNGRSAGDYATSEQSFRTIITNHPTSPLIHEATYNLSLVLIDQKRESEALAQLETIKNSEREPDALLEIGRIALNRDNLSKSETTFLDLRRRFPSSNSAERSYLVLGSWYESQSDWDKAISTYEQARKARLSLDSQQRVILGLARVHRESGRNALQLYTQFLKVHSKSPYLPDARLGLGRAYVDKKQYRQAIDAFKRLQESFPGHPFSIAAHRDIGDVFNALGSPRRALGAYERHLSLTDDPRESAITKLRVGILYRESLGWSDLSLDLLSELSEGDDPEIAGPAQFHKGRTREAAGDSQLAIREYREYLERFAGQPQAKEAETKIRYLSTFAPTASVDHELIDILGNTEDRGKQLELGRLLYTRRYFDEALKHLEAAANDTTHPGTAEASFLLAEALFAIDLRDQMLGQSSQRHGSQISSLLTKLTGNTNAFSDDAALRLIDIQHESGPDTTLARARINAFDQFLKTYPSSDQLDDARLAMAAAHLDMGSQLPEHSSLAHQIYQDVSARHEEGDRAEKSRYGIGRSLAIKRDYVDAENALRDFLFDFPNSVLEEEARFQLGLILLERGYLQSAAQEFAELLNAPTSVALERSSRTLLAECYFRLEDFDGAIRIDETLATREAEPAVLKRLGEAYMRTGNDEMALEVLGTFVRRFASTSGADTLSFKRAELFAQLGRTDQAIDAFNELSTRFPKSALKSDALSSVARLQFEKGNYTDALASASPTASAKDAAIAELRIVTLLRLDRVKQARKEVKTFKKAFPGKTEALARFDVEEARVQLRYGNPKGARKTLENVLNKYAASRAAGDAEYYLIGAIEKVGDPDEHLAALISFVKNRDDNSNWGKANIALADIYDANEDYVSAARSYTNALKGQLDHQERPEVLSNLYKSHRNLRSHDSAIAYARDLITQYPHDSRAQDARIDIGQMYSEKGAYAQAINELRPLLTKLQGDDWSLAQETIAASFERMADYEGGLREYLKLVYNHQGSVNWIANAFMGRARCFEALGKPREAIGELDKIVARFNGDSFALGAQAKINELKREIQ